MNTFGHNLKVTTFGESHGKAIGGIIDGFPSGFKIDFEFLQREIDKRSPGSSPLVTQRKEKDIPEFMSGINEDGITLGTPIGFIIKNTDSRSKDYTEIAHSYRPNHADYTYDVKYGIRDYRGGGRASARETANWVVAGALAQQWLMEKYDIKITTELTAVGEISFTDLITDNLANNPDNSNLYVSAENKKTLEEEIEKIKRLGDSVGGIVTCLIQNVPPGYGDPVFGKLQAELAKAMLSINASKGFEYGYGFNYAKKKGSETLDTPYKGAGIVKTEKNFSGGIQGGITNGMPIYFNVAFKPTPTILMPVKSLTDDFNPTELKIKGRHDPCVALRGVAVVKALAALVVADILL